MTSINSAIVLAQQGKKVLLVDADLRRPSVHLSFGLRPHLGLSNILSGGSNPAAATFPTRQKNLFVVPAGALPPQPSGASKFDRDGNYCRNGVKNTTTSLSTPPVYPLQTRFCCRLWRTRSPGCPFGPDHRWSGSPRARPATAR